MVAAHVPCPVMRRQVVPCNSARALKAKKDLVINLMQKGGTNHEDQKQVIGTGHNGHGFDCRHGFRASAAGGDAESLDDPEVRDAAGDTAGYEQ
jgi:hypothetical protein